MPPPVLVADPADLTGIVAQVPEAARALMEAFWPGALTLILEADETLTWDLGETGGTLAGAHARAPRILRQGVLAQEDLERVAGLALSEGTAGAGRDRTGAGA